MFWSSLPLFGGLLVSHPWETIKINSIIHPDLPLQFLPLRDLIAYQRGLLPQVAAVAIHHFTRAVLNSHLGPYLDNLNPKKSDELVQEECSWSRIKEVMWEVMPRLVFGWVGVSLAYPFHLLSVLSSFPINGSAPDLVTIAQSIYAKHGICAFWTGLVPKLISSTLYPMIGKMTSDWLYRTWINGALARISSYPRSSQHYLARQSSQTQVYLSSILGHLLAAAITLPFDACTIECQTATLLSGPIPSSFTVAKLLIERYRWDIFSNGMAPQLLKYLSWSITYASLATYLQPRLKTNNP